MNKVSIIIIIIIIITIIIIIIIVVVIIIIIIINTYNKYKVISFLKKISEFAKVFTAYSLIIEIIVQTRVSVLPLISKYRQAGCIEYTRGSLFIFNHLVCI